LILSMSTNEATYVMVVFECGNNYWKIPIDIFIVNLTLWNGLEISTDHYHWSGWLGKTKQHTILEGMHVDLLKQNFEWT
jgi:hypothetical protein